MQREAESRNDRKPWLRAIFAAALLLPFAAYSADSYPSRPIRMIVGSGPGSAPDALARIVGQRLSEELGQQFVVDNRAGATGTMGAKHLATAQPDGYTLGIVAAAFATTASTMSLTYDVRKDFQAVAGIASVPLILVMSTASEATSVSALVALARARPGAVNYASPGAGGLQHLVTEAFSQLVGINMVHVPYKSGSLAVTAVVGGEAQLFFSGMPPALPLVNQGRLRGLAVTTMKRFPAAPNVPTMQEAGYKGFEADNWHGFMAPVNIPGAHVARINRVLSKVLGTPDIKQKFLVAGAEAQWSSGAAFQKLVNAEVERWAGVARAVGIKPQ